MVLHDVATLNSLALRELGELVTATDVFGLGGQDGEVAGEHARGDLPAVCAVAHESAYEAGCFGWLCNALVSFASRHFNCWSFTYEEKLNCTTETCSCRCVVIPPAGDAFGRQWYVSVAHGGS